MSEPDHLGLSEPDADCAILTGDPARAAALAERLGAPLLTDRRGFACYLIRRPRPVLLVATGIGGPAMAIAAEELIGLGVRALVRLGSCGAVDAAVEPGDLVVASGCVRDDGTSRAYLDPAFPAVAHPDLAARLAAAAGQGDAPVHLGLTHCKDAYYAEKAGALPDERAAGQRWRTLKAAGVLATEMEAAALFTVAQLRGVAAAGIFCAVGPTRARRDRDLAACACEAALSALDGFAADGGLQALRPRPLDPGAASHLARPDTHGEVGR